MSIATLLGIITGLAVGLIAYFIAIKATKKYRFGNKEDFDEKQKIDQGKAYRVGFLTFMLYSTISGSLDICLENGLPMEGSIISFIGLVIGAFAFASYAVFHECYISLNEKSIRTKIILLVLGVINLMLGLISLYHQDLVENGRLTTRILPLLTGLLLLAIILEILIKERLDKRECLDEES